MPREIITL
jgi:tubulin gamma